MTWRRPQRAAALVEFALAWPIALLIVLATVEMAVWASEVFAARAASLAGARAGTIAGGSAAVAARVAAQSLSPSLVGDRPQVWCPADGGRAPRIWVCAVDRGAEMEVDVGGQAPALVSLLPGSGLPLTAHAVLPKEAYTS
jgi:hypothetical protein